MAAHHPIATCTATNRQGNPCTQPAIKGGNVCRYHGGAAPQTLAAARLRLAALVDPAIGVLAYAIKQKSQNLPAALTAAKDAMDRAGLKVSDKLEVSGAEGGPLVVRYVDAAPVVVNVNGKVNGHGD